MILSEPDVGPTSTAQLQKPANAGQKPATSRLRCAAPRASILTGRRPSVGMHAALTADWCCCQRTNCSKDALFMTTQHGACHR
jgi:hypothetical protein